MKQLLRNLISRASAAFSIVPSYLANIAWYLSDRFLQLVSEGYRKNSVVYSCIRLKSESVPEPPLKIYVPTGIKGGEQEDPNHPLRKLIQKPNALQTEFEFWELTDIYLEIAGRAHWWKERSNDDSVIALWPLRPDRVKPIYGTGLPPLWGWEYNLDGMLWQVPAKDVLTFNYPNPDDPTGGVVEGLGPLQVLSREVDTDNSATRFTYALLKNYAVPSILIKTKAKLNEQQAKLLKMKFMSQYGGEKVGEPGVLDSDTDIEKLSFDLRQLEFPDLRAINESRIASGFGVPAILVGLKVGLDKATYSNAEQAEVYFTNGTLSRLWTRLQSQITHDFQDEYPDQPFVARFDTSRVRALQKQQNEQAKRYETGLMRGAVKVNEYREKALGLPPEPGWDVFLIPRGMIITATPQIEPVEPKEPKTPPPAEAQKDYNPDRLSRIRGLLGA